MVRKKLDLDQRQAAEIFGGGVNAFSRYENRLTESAPLESGLVNFCILRQQLLVKTSMTRKVSQQLLIFHNFPARVRNVSHFFQCHRSFEVAFLAGSRVIQRWTRTAAISVLSPGVGCFLIRPMIATF